MKEYIYKKIDKNAVIFFLYFGFFYNALYVEIDLQLFKSVKFHQDISY